MPKLRNKSVDVIKELDGDLIQIRHQDGREETVQRSQLTELPPKSQGKPPEHSSAGGNPPEHAQGEGKPEKPEAEPR